MGRAYSHLLAALAASWAFAWPAWAASAPAPAPVVRASADEAAPSTDGTFQLNWEVSELPPPVEYHVQLSGPGPDAGYLDWYRGPARESFVSGLPSGKARVRVRARGPSDETWSRWSEPLVVPIEHHSMAGALSLLALGAAVFLTLVSYISVMAYQTRSRDKAAQ